MPSSSATHAPPSARLQLAVDIAREAGRLTLNYFQTEFVRETKQDGSVVTIADRESEQWMRGRIEEAFPSDGVLGEEFGEKPASSRYRWILDPIDGTLSFAQGVPLYGVLIGIEDLEAGECPIGVIHMPALSESVYAEKGCGCWWERPATGPLQPGTPATVIGLAHVSGVGSLDRAVLLSTDFWKLGDESRRRTMADLAERTRVQRTWADCYGYLLVATGRAEIMLDPIMKVWDCAALQSVLEEAGGTFTDWSGKRTVHGGCGVATNGSLLEEVLPLLRGKREG